MSDGDEEFVDWFGICEDPELDVTRKCAFCKDSKKSPLDDPELWENDYRTTACRHRACRICQKLFPAGQSKCGLCGSKIVQYTEELPEYMALKTLNEIRKDICKEWNLSEEDFPTKENFERFLEDREKLIADILLARSSSDIKTREAIEKSILARRVAFRAAHTEAIARNEAKRTEERLRIESQMRGLAQELKRLKKVMEDEWRNQEEERVRQKEEANNTALGIRVSAPDAALHASSSHQAAQPAQTYMPRQDLLSLAGPAPIHIKSGKRAKVDLELAARAGGFSVSIVVARSLSELHAGWDLLLL